MSPNDQQNYWQPQDEPETQIPSVADETPRGRTGADLQIVEWEASEAIEGSKGAIWYVGFFIVVLTLLAAMIFLREWIFAALIVVVAITLLIMSRRSPRVIRYVLNAQGLTIDGGLRAFTEFRAFGIVRDGAFFAIKLIPVGRFSPEVTVYFAQQDGERIVDILGAYLPMEEMKMHIFDRITRKLGL